jgi:ribonucleotide reductase alpha subunit
MWGRPRSGNDTTGGVEGKIKANGCAFAAVSTYAYRLTSQILGYNECIEPITSNIYSRCTIGEFIMANKYLMTDLIKLDLWSEKLKNNIIANGGSVHTSPRSPPRSARNIKQCGRWDGR